MSDSSTSAPAQQLAPPSQATAGAWIGALAYLLAATGLLFACEWANRGSAADAARWLGTRLLEIRPLLARLIGFVFILATLLVAVQLTGRRWLGIVIGAVPWSGIALATMLKRDATGDPLVPADLMLSGGTIGAAIDAVSLPLTPVFLLILAIAGAVFAERRWPARRRPWRTRIAIIAVALTISTILCASAGWLGEHKWIDRRLLRVTRRYANYGLAAGFVFDLRDLRRYTLTMPEGYSAAAIATIAAKYPPTNPPVQAAARPSIIIVQLESMLDPAQTHLLPADVEVLPNLRTMHRQFGAIHAISSTYGGRSANSEFEANTGLSMALLREGCVAYEHIVRKDIPSLARIVGDHGYSSTSIVCGYSTLFRYNEVYSKHLGFGRVVFADELMPEARGYETIPDAVVLNRVIKAVEESPGPAYVFASTGHAHTPWPAERFPNRQFEALLPANLPQRQEFAGYLQAAHECDAAVGDFIQRLGSLNRPMLVFFYGDHHPGLAPELVQRMGLIAGRTASTPAEILATHTTMAAFWTNVPGVSFPSGPIGVNYAGSALLEAAGIPHPFYTGLLGKARQRTRAFVPGLYVGIDGAALSEPPADVRADLRDYEFVQYDVLAGSQCSIGSLFAPLK